MNRGRVRSPAAARVIAPGCGVTCTGAVLGQVEIIDGESEAMTVPRTDNAGDGPFVRERPPER